MDATLVQIGKRYQRTLMTYEEKLGNGEFVTVLARHANIANCFKCKDERTGNIKILNAAWIKCEA
jgi:hypothetical protein